MNHEAEAYGPPERVYVENQWYDGPRAGVSDVNGLPHRFKSLFDEGDDEYLGAFLIWPIDSVSLQLEIEQWAIFVEWNTRYESGVARLEPHPGHGGVSKRWDEIDEKLKHNRELVPASARHARAEVEAIDRERRYEFSGPAYRLRWRIL